MVKIISVVTSPTVRRSLEIVSAISSANNSMARFISDAVESELPYVGKEDCKPRPYRGKAYRVTTNLISPEMNQELDKKARSWGTTKTTVVVACVKKRLMIEVSRWGCESLTEFVSLMRSPDPVKLIEKRKNKVEKANNIKG
jgi:hypothetical protein